MTKYDGGPPDSEFSGDMWTKPTVNDIDDIEAVWPPLEAGNLEEFAAKFARFAINQASKDFMRDGNHEVTFVLVKGVRSLHVLTESTVKEVVEGSGNPSAKLAMMLSGTSPKDLLAKMVSAAARSMDAKLVVHISEAWMTALPRDLRNDPKYKESFDKLESGQLSLRDLPEDMRSEVLIVRTEAKDGKCIFMRRVITRDKDNKPSLGPVEMLEDLTEDEKSPGRGRFSDYWNPDAAQGVEAITVEVNSDLSTEVWEYDYPEEGKSNANNPG